MELTASASSVEKRMARALFVFRIDRFAIVIPMRSARSVSVTGCRAASDQSLTRIAISVRQIVSD